MATTTILRTINGVDDVRAALSNSTLRRLLSIGSNWNSLRIALRLSMDDPGSNLSGTRRFVVGVCSGTTNPWNNGAAITTHFVGVSHGFDPWYRNVSGSLISMSPALGYAHKRVGTTITQSAVPVFNDSVRGFPCDANRARTLLLFTDISKGSPNFSFRTFIANGNAPTETRESFMALAPSPSPSKTNYYHYPAVTLGVSESSHGALDAVNIGWDTASPRIEISDLAIVRLS